MQQKHYRHIFFDLDRTLWDFDRNSIETFMDIHTKYDLQGRGVRNFDVFMDVYHKINFKLWENYRKGEIKKEVLSVQRFALTLDSFGIEDNGLSEDIARDYVSLSPLKCNLFPGTIELLEYLKPKYTLHIITNGFEEVQHKKLANASLTGYFSHVITSEDAGYKKPDPNIFNYAFAITGSTPDESLMIGDDPDVDIMGAANVGMDQIMVDYLRVYEPTSATYHVTSLPQIMQIL